MKTLASLVFYLLSACFIVEGTINVCIPLKPVDIEETKTNKLLQLVQSSIAQNLEHNNKPIEIGHVDVDFTHPAVRLIGTLDEVRVYNLLDYEMCLIDFNFTTNSLTLFNLTFMEMTLNGTYDLTGDIGDIFDIYGTGNFWMKLTNFSIAMTDFNLTMDEEICFPITIEINVAEMKNQFYNFMYDEDLGDLFNKAIEQIAPESMEIMWKEWKDIFDAPLEKAINDYFHQKHVKTLLWQIVRSKEGHSIFPYCFTNDDQKIAQY